MIFHTAVAEYVDRPLRDLGRAKRWSDATIGQKMTSLERLPRFKTIPYKHQSVGFLLAVKYPHLFCLFDLGLGKTKVVLDAFRYLKDVSKLHRCLILVPNIVNLESWRQEIATHAPDLMASYIMGDKRDRLEAWEGETDLCLSTYAGLQHLVCSKAGEKRVLDDALIKKACTLFDGVVWDESVAVMNHRSLNFRIARKLTAKFKWRIALTGTPLGRDPQVLWPQFYCVDRGEALGETMGPFREAFFHIKEGYWGGYEYTFKKQKEPDLRRMMAHSSIRYASDECFDLPEKIMVQRPFAMTDEAWSYYSAVLEQARSKGDKFIDLKGIFVRLRQIASGFVSVNGQPSALAQNPKLESLLELLDELPPKEKVVVFQEFIWSGDQIMLALAERKDGSSLPARLYSGTKDKAGELRRFQDDPDCRVFLVNSQSGAQGLNLQGASRYVLFYESPVSCIVRQQAEARCYRSGQSRSVFIYDLFAKHTVEQKILRFLAEGKSLFDALVSEGLGLLRPRRRLD